MKSSRKEKLKERIHKTEKKEEVGYLSTVKRNQPQCE